MVVRRVWMVAALVALQVFPVGAQQRMPFPTTTSARREVIGALIVPVDFACYPTTIHETRVGERVHVDGHEQEGANYLSFTPVADGEAPLDSRGTYIVRQRQEGATFDQVKIFLLPRSQTFVRVRARDHVRGSVAEVVVAGYPIYREIPLAWAMERVAVAPFAQLHAALASVVEWSAIEPYPLDPRYQRSARLAQAVRGALPSLIDGDDGAPDRWGVARAIDPANGNAVDGFNCSGFAKWVVDWMVWPLLGEGVPLQDLRRYRPPTHESGWRRQRDTIDADFGLWWTRALGAEWARIAPREGDEVGEIGTLSPFSSRHKGGFPIEALPALAYRAAVEYPGQLLLGSVSSLQADGVVRRYHHVVVLMPYFTTDGEFRAPLFERNEEGSVAELIARYPSSEIHLVRLPIAADVHQPGIEVTP